MSVKKEIILVLISILMALQLPEPVEENNANVAVVAQMETTVNR